MLDLVATSPATPSRAALPTRLAVAGTRLRHWLLRIACAAEFVGHGAFGIIGKAAWLPYFGVVGIPPEAGVEADAADRHRRHYARAGRRPGWPGPSAPAVHGLLGLLTATIRPLSGEPIWEFVERVPNWAVPLAFFGVRSMGQPRPGRPTTTGYRTANAASVELAAAA